MTGARLVPVRRGATREGSSWSCTAGPAAATALRDTQVLVVHGGEDRIALPTRSAELARRLEATTPVGYVTIPGGRHAMLRHARVFESYAADFVTATLLGAAPRSEAVAAVLAGSR
jgi:alpha-beta hydrolase superfamily lysophospholipase